MIFVPRYEQHPINIAIPKSKLLTVERWLDLH